MSEANWCPDCGEPRGVCQCEENEQVIAEFESNMYRMAGAIRELRARIAAHEIGGRKLEADLEWVKAAQIALENRITLWREDSDILYTALEWLRHISFSEGDNGEPVWPGDETREQIEGALKHHVEMPKNGDVER